MLVERIEVGGRGGLVAAIGVNRLGKARPHGGLLGDRLQLPRAFVELARVVGAELVGIGEQQIERRRPVLHRSGVANFLDRGDGLGPLVIEQTATLHHPDRRRHETQRMQRGGSAGAPLAGVECCLGGGDELAAFVDFDLREGLECGFGLLERLQALLCSDEKPLDDRLERRHRLFQGLHRRTEVRRCAGKEDGRFVDAVLRPVLVVLFGRRREGHARGKQAGAFAFVGLPVVSQLLGRLADGLGLEQQLGRSGPRLRGRLVVGVFQLVACAGDLRRDLVLLRMRRDAFDQQFDGGPRRIVGLLVLVDRRGRRARPRLVDRRASGGLQLRTGHKTQKLEKSHSCHSHWQRYARRRPVFKSQSGQRRGLGRVLASVLSRQVRVIFAGMLIFEQLYRYDAAVYFVHCHDLSPARRHIGTRRRFLGKRQRVGAREPRPTGHQQQESGNGRICTHLRR